MSDREMFTDSLSEADTLRAQLGELTDALVSANDQLLALYQLAGFSAGSLEPAVAVERGLSEARSIIGAESVAFIVAVNDGSLAVASSVGDDASALLDVMGDDGSAGGTAARIDRNLPDGRGHLSAPVRADGRSFGIIRARSVAGGLFTTADLKLLEAVANHLAVILELSALHEDAVQQTMIQWDHEAASALARAVLQRTLPEMAGVDLAAASRPARSAGGDFYAAGRSTRGLYLALGDVSGKGLPAALVMTTATTATQGAFERHPDGDPGAVLSDIDTQLADYLGETGMFITMAVAHVDPLTGVLRITNAGQSPAAIVSNGRAVAIPADGPPIGVLEPRAHPTNERMVGEGDVLFIGSDGCTDQTAPDDTMVGTERVHRLLESRSWQGSDHLVQMILDRVADHADGKEQDDDVTAIVLRLTAGPEAP